MYNNDSNSLNAGAPDIRLTGNQDPNTQMASDPSGGAELYQVYQNALQSGQLPKGTTFEMFKELSYLDARKAELQSKSNEMPLLEDYLIKEIYGGST